MCSTHLGTLSRGTILSNYENEIGYVCVCMCDHLASVSGRLVRVIKTLFRYRIFDEGTIGQEMEKSNVFQERVHAV